MQRRTEEEVVGELPVHVSLGGKEYDIKPLTLLKAMAWRKQFGPQLAKVMSAHASNADTPDDFLVAFLESPELMVDALFAYAPQLPKKQIMESCTEMELLRAFTQVMGVAFGPFLGQAAFMTQFKRELTKAMAQPVHTSPPFH
jgi:hypothetical protein